ncbi:MAG: AAA family ATPase [Candidatus Cloacimonadota bacterium]|nr:MAG: AAA family ATPase [Candidatus Cloacimonadota bacterium]
MQLKKVKDDVRVLEELREAKERIEKEISKVIIGQKKVIEELLTVLISGGHCLIIGVPGLAKTLLVNTLAQVLSLKFNRIQFTPDLMPSDITGTDILEVDSETGKRAFRFIRGPIFANVVLADEINRTPPKTQAALLQAMQEYKVTAGGVTYKVEQPFFVLATQNPIEQEGTYPLPEAQLDRFMFNLLIEYPEEAEEIEIAKTSPGSVREDLKNVLGSKKILELQELVRRVPVSDSLLKFAVRLVSMSRPRSKDAPDFVDEWVSWGASPRATQYLILAAKTNAVLDGRYTPGIEDIKKVVFPVLRHRIITNFNAEAEGITTDRIIGLLLDNMKE